MARLIEHQAVRTLHFKVTAESAASVALGMAVGDLTRAMSGAVERTVDTARQEAWVQECLPLERGKVISYGLSSLEPGAHERSAVRSTPG